MTALVRTFPPPPPEFAEQFADGGWRRVERIYGARTSLIRKWIALTGAVCRHPRTRGRERGRKAA